MPKTGTSSIQATLAKKCPEGWIIPSTGSANGNMSRDFSLLFEKEPLEGLPFRATRTKYNTPEAVLQLANETRDTFDRLLTDGSKTGRNTIFSSERACMAPEDAIVRLRDFYVTRGYRPRVVAYVRKPVSFLQSAFQQKLKTLDTNLFSSNALVLKYRFRFEKFDKVFGRENVKLKLFDPLLLKGKDVVLDFFDEIHHDLNPDHIVRTNESLSLTACAFLYAQRVLGSGYVTNVKSAAAKNAAFVAELGKFRCGKFRLKRSFVEPFIDENKSDIQWMEERLGRPILDLPERDDPDAVGCEEDLLRVAEENLHKLDEALLAKIALRYEHGNERLLNALELLRKLHY